MSKNVFFMLALFFVMMSTIHSVKLASKTRFFTKALETLIHKGLGGKSSSANAKCFKMYQEMLKNPKLKGPAGTLGKMNQDHCCADAAQISSHSGVTSIGVVVARALYVDGCAYKWSDFKDEIKSQLKDIKSDIWGTVQAIAEKFA
jgi:hypothetical protein